MTTFGQKISIKKSVWSYLVTDWWASRYAKRLLEERCVAAVK